MTFFRFVVLCALPGLGLSGCIGNVALQADHVGFVECTRLDREPFDGERSATCTDGAAEDAQIGTFHRRPDIPLNADVLPVSMDADQAARLPVSDCLWTAASLAGNGDLIAPLWDAAMRVADADTLELYHRGLSACRLDPIHQRNALGGAGVRRLECGELAASKITIDDDFDAGVLKTACDNDVSFFDMRLLLRRAGDTRYARCGIFTDTVTEVSGLPKPLSNCAPVRVVGEPDDARGVQFQYTLLNRDDGRFNISGQTGRDLFPALRSVVDRRSIARQLTFDDDALSWHTPVLIDGSPGRQRWHENFVSSIRVDKIRVFSVTDAETDDRVYLALTDAQLRLIDPADPGADLVCLGDSDEIDLRACNLQVTPTYRIDSIVSGGILPDPLEWRLSVGDVGDPGRQLFIEFDLSSVARSSQMALTADVPTLDFGGITLGSYGQHRVKLTNEGTGRLTIDAVRVTSTQAPIGTFVADLLDDAIRQPVPLALAPTDKPDVYELAVEPELFEQPLFGVDEQAFHASLVPNPLDGESHRLFGHEVTFAGYAPVLSGPAQEFELEGHQRYPFWVSMYRPWTLPYSLNPGESRLVFVKAKPIQTDVQKAWLDVEAYPDVAPAERQTIRVSLKVTGLTGPQGFISPVRLRFPRTNGDDALRALLVSHGSHNLARDRYVVSDIADPLHTGDANYFSVDASLPTHHQIAAGSSELITVTYDPGCLYVMPVDGRHRAQVVVETDVGPLTLALSGDPEAWARHPGRCGPGPQ